jgi:hypothetical protein
VSTTGAGVLQPLKTYTAQVRVVASNPIPAQTTSLVYQATVPRAGALGRTHAAPDRQATATWQAYNSYGGVSFYTSLSAGSGRLTFERPYNEGQGSGQYLTLQQGLVFWAESKGLDVTYWTENDLDQYGGDLKDRAGTLLLPGHDEYYSLRMRAAISQAIEAGVNVATLGRTPPTG